MFGFEPIQSHNSVLHFGVEHTYLHYRSDNGEKLVTCSDIQLVASVFQLSHKNSHCWERIRSWSFSNTFRVIDFRIHNTFI